LADYFNQELLEAATESAGATPLKGEVENLYHLFTDDDVTSGVREQTRNRLDQQGIDAERIEDDFVTYRSVQHCLVQGV